MKQKNMYPLSVKQWNPFVGCHFNCIYCYTSFRRQIKRFSKNKCNNCYNFLPHTHPTRLDNSLPRTEGDEFIFTCSNGDVSFCSTPYLKKILTVIEQDKNTDKTFLIQSKNPKTFNRIQFPDNVILGVTLETNRDEYKISKAPKVSQRYKDFLKVKHNRKMITTEPIMDFDHREFVSWVKNIDPCMVWLGYDSGKNNLPEPSLEKFKKLHKALRDKGFRVILKTVREE